MHCPTVLAVPGLGLTLGLTVDERGRAFAVYAVSPRTRAVARLDAGEKGNATLMTLVEGNFSLPLTEAAGVVAHDGVVYTCDGGALWGFSAESGVVVQQMAVNAAADTFGMAVQTAGGGILLADSRGGPVTAASP